MKNNFDSVLSSFPEFLKPEDLVRLGLYPSQSALTSARLRKEGPSYIKFKRKILYPKINVIDFILKHIQKDQVL